jgi:aspartate aminotransferase
MQSGSTSQRIAHLQALVAPFARFFTDSAYARLHGEPDIVDFTFGDPHEMPLPGFVEALQRWSMPRNESWFAYKMNEPEARDAVIASLLKHRGLTFETDDIFLTNGAFAALAVSLNAVVDPGDEVIFCSPPWFFYEAQVAAAGAIPVRVGIDRVSFDLDLAAIGAAITAKTRAIIINTPHNPTGKVYTAATLQKLSALLSTASEQVGRPIYLLSDESYCRIVYDGRSCPSPAAIYPHTLLLYTYGKTLLTPGQRLGYIAIAPTLPEREALRRALLITQLLTGYAFPNALLQHALPDLETLSINVNDLQNKRDQLVERLRTFGYEVGTPEGTFYILVRSPIADDWVFVEYLAARGVLCLPGSVFEMPGYFRLSLTANWEMIDKALPSFAAAIQTTAGARV